MMSVGAVLSSPAIASGTIVFGSTDGNVYVLQ
jgi:outer membrane protein assembly factor BamB